MTAADEPSHDSFGGATLPFEVLVLTIGGTGRTPTQIALPASAVREVARADRITPYPGAPPDLPGVTAVRGRIVAVLDLVPREDDPPCDALGHASGVLVIVDVGGRTLALAGATPVRVVASAAAASPASVTPLVSLWSGRVLRLVGSVRLLDASRPDADDGAVLPLIDGAALIDDVIDDPDGGR